MRKLLCGAAAVGFLVVCVPVTASAQEHGGEPTLTPAEAAEEIEHIAEEAGLEHDVIECVAHAAENNDSDSCVESPSPILPASNEVIWGGLSFLVLFVVLWKFGVPAARSMVEARTQKINADIDEAERARTEAESLKAQYEQRLREANQEAARIVEDARQQAEQVRRDLTARAEAEAAELRQRNAEQVAAERERVLGELRHDVGTLAIELAEKVVESNLDRDANMRLIENYINSVGARKN